MKKYVLLLTIFILFFVVNSSITFAHVEHADPGLEKDSILYQIFTLHDWLHPLFYIFLIYSCYYFRFFSGKNISKEPKKCLGGCNNCYKGEGRIKQYHRYFFWGTLLLAFIHVAEIWPSLMNYSKLTGINFWILVFESSYLAFGFLYLFTCYHFRYFVERLANRKIVSYKIYNGLTLLNRHHNIFFWLVIITVAIRFTLVMIDTGSIIQAIPGTF